MMKGGIFHLRQTRDASFGGNRVNPPNTQPAQSLFSYTESLTIQTSVIFAVE